MNSFVCMCFYLTILCQVSESRLSARTYFYHGDPLNWTAARDKCEEYGGTLTIVRDISTMPDINASMPAKRFQQVWIGLYFVKDVWRWVDSSIYKWSNWQPYFEEFDGDCVSVIIGKDYFWKKTSCDELKPFYCELQQGTCYYNVYKESFVSGFDIFSKDNTTLEHCSDICEYAPEITCLSFEYSKSKRSCKVSNINRWIESDSFMDKYPTEWDYFHKTCTTVKNWSDIHNAEEAHTTSISSTSILSSAESPTTIPKHNVSIPEARRYILYNHNLSWDKAREFCLEQGGDLATIYDQATIPETEYAREFEGKTVWIGLSRTPDRYWYWSDGTELKWTNWMYKPSESDRLRKCIMLLLNQQGQWYQSVCHTELWFLCQFPSESCTYTVVRNSGIINHNKAVYNDINVKDCMERCDNMTDFQCMSFEYFPHRNTCQMSDKSRWTLPMYYQTGLTGLNYYHRRCNFGKQNIQQTTTTTSTTTTTTTSTTTTTTTEAPTTTTTTPATTTQTTTESTTDATSTEAETTTDQMKYFKVIKEELVAYGDKIREKRLQQKRTSAVDNRPSATGAGVVATVILATLIGFIVFLDITTIKAHCNLHKNLRNRRRRRSHKSVDSIGETNFIFKVDEVVTETGDPDDRPNSSSQSLNFEHCPDEYSGENGIESNEILVEIRNSRSDDNEVVNNDDGMKNVACQTDTPVELTTKSSISGNSKMFKECVSVETQTCESPRVETENCIDENLTSCSFIMDETKL